MSNGQTRTRRAIVFTGKERVELREEPVPALEPGRLLVRTTRSLISTGTESICFTRNFAPGTHWDHWVKYPFPAGYLNVGRVEAVGEGGEGVQGWSVGDRVASRGHHASHVVVRAGDAVRVPEGVSDEDAAWMGLGKIVQVGVRAAEHVLGDAVVVIGLGLLGQLVVQYARLMGAREVIAIDTAERRLAWAEQSGATRVLRMTAAEALPEVKRLTGGRLADVVYDVTGHPAVFATALPLARKFGKVILLGDAGRPELQHLTSDVITRGLRILGAHDMHAPAEPSDLAPWSARAMGELVLHFIARGQLRVNHLITHRVRPADAAEVYAMLQTKRDEAMGVVYEWDE